MSSGAISLYFWSQFCYSYSSLTLGKNRPFRITWTIFWPYLIPARYLNPESCDDFVADPASRRYLNPVSRDNFGANPVSRDQKKAFSRIPQDPIGGPLHFPPYSNTLKSDPGLLQSVSSYQFLENFRFFGDFHFSVTLFTSKTFSLGLRFYFSSKVSAAIYLFKFNDKRAK